MIKHVFSDLDGTLYKNGISQRNKDLIDEANKKGITIHIATGRVYHQALEMTKNTNVKGYYICENGSYIYDKNQKQIDKGVLNDNQVRKIIRFYNSMKDVDQLNELLYFKYDGKVISLEKGDGSLLFPSKFIVMSSFIKLDSYENKVGNAGISMNDIEKLKVVEARFEEKFGKELDIYFSSETTINIVPKGVSKFEAIKKVCNLNHIKLDEIAVIGDSPNDLCMIEGIKESFSISSGNYKVKNKSKYIVDEVADAIECIFQKNKKK